MTTKHAGEGNLPYYLAHKISPVRYEATTPDEHFDRRDALYRTLGLPPLAFRNARVLEVAPGSGQNSLYVASLQPASLDLVEPNPTGVVHLKAVFATHGLPLVTPRIHEMRFEDFRPETQYDIVICENCFGSTEWEVALISRLADLVAPGGALIITAVPVAGFFANIMRKLLALRLMRAGQDFETTTGQLVRAFGPHLATIEGMTRSHQDWVQDCMINPHYLFVAVPFETLFDAVGDKLEWLGSSPRFTQDWRWFKRLTGPDRRFNKSFLASTAAALPMFVDHRLSDGQIDESTAARLARLYDDAYVKACDWQAVHETGGSTADASDGLAQCIAALAEIFQGIEPTIADAYLDLHRLWVRHTISVEAVAGMDAFRYLFGRETVYVALTRPRIVGAAIDSTPSRRS